MKHVFFGVALALIAGSAAAQTPAALVSVRADAGEVQINNVTLQAGQSASANPGDTVVVTNGQAVVTYSSGCTVTVDGSYTVAPKAPSVCPSDAKSRNGMSTGTTIAIGAGVVAAAAAAGGAGGGDDKPSSP